MPSFYIAVVLSAVVAIATLSTLVGPLLTFAILLFSASILSIAVQLKTGLSPIDQLVSAMSKLTSRFIGLHKPV